MKVIGLCVTLTLCFFLFFCTEETEKNSLADAKDVRHSQDRNLTNTPIEAEENQGAREEIDNIGIVNKLTPETFVKITILYNSTYQNWLEESQNLPTDEQRRFLDEMNMKFFSQFGLTEDEYVKYSQNNMEELNNYIASHPELLVKLKKQ
jgi:hypothetical protein